MCLFHINKLPPNDAQAIKPAKNAKTSQIEQLTTQQTITETTRNLNIQNQTLTGTPNAIKNHNFTLTFTKLTIN